MEPLRQEGLHIFALLFLPSECSSGPLLQVSLVGRRFLEAPGGHSAGFGVLVGLFKLFSKNF